MNEDLVIIEGYSTTNSEVREAQRRADESERRLKELQARVAKAEARENAIDEAEARRIETEDRIRELEAELEALRKEQEEAAPFSRIFARTSVRFCPRYSPCRQRKAG